MLLALAAQANADDLIFADGFESGNTSAWSTIVGSSDETPPAILTTTPADGSWVGSATPTVGATYSDLGSGVLASSVVLVVDGVDRTSEATVSTSSTSWTPGEVLAGGPHQVEISVGDQAGNASSDSWSFSVDTVPPSIGLLVVDRFDPATSILAVFGDVDSGILPGSLAVHLDGAEITSHCTPMEGYSVCQPPAPLAWGPHTATAEIRDVVQHVGTTMHEFVAEPDLIAPEIRFVALPGLIVNLSELTVEIDLFDDGRGIDPESFALALDGAAISACTTDIGHANCLLTGFDEGAHALVASVEDLAGNAGTAVAEFRLVVDAEGPAIALLPAAGAQLLNPDGVRFEARYEDSELGLDASTVTVLLDGLDITEGCSVDSWSAVCNPALPAVGEHDWSVQVADNVGNFGQASASFEVVHDLTPPTLSIGSPVPGVGYNQATVEPQLTVADSGVGIADARLRVWLDFEDVTASCARNGSEISCAVLAVGPGLHELSAEAGDLAGNMASTAVAFEIVNDVVPPLVELLQPENGLLIGAGGEDLVLRIEDAETALAAGIAAVSVNGQVVACTIEGATFACSLGPLERGEATVSVSATDLAGNATSWSAMLQVMRPLTVAIAQPVDELSTSAATILVAGTVEAGAVSVEVNGEPAALAGTAFEHPAVPLHDGTNFIEVVARDSRGSLGFDRVYVLVDRTPPQLSVLEPEDGAIVREPRVDVLGLVNDLTLGTIEEGDVDVTVNGVAAAVANRSFSKIDLPLSPGPNPIEVVATSASGSVSRQLTVTYEPPAGDRLTLVSGNGQEGIVRSLLGEPLVVRLTDALGAPLVGRTVVFRVTTGSGGFGDGERATIVTTDSGGMASVSYRLGDRSGPAFNRVRASAAGAEGPVAFSAAATPGPATQVLVAAGNNQRGAVGEELAIPLTVVVLDAEDNPVAGELVELAVVQGSGKLEGSSELTRTSDASGRVRARFTLGAEHGFDSPQFVAAGLPGSATRAVFEEVALRSTPPVASSISGSVLDNQGDPVPGVTLRLRDLPMTTTTASNGTFTLAGVPVGHLYLIVDPSTTTRPGMWATLEIELFVVGSVDNPLERPIYILPLDLPHAIVVSETTGGTIELPEHPGFKLEVAPGSAVFPGGGRSGVISATLVHPDRIPMAPSAGMQPRIIATIQPAGTLFDPPARFTLPNLEGLSPGSVTEMFSFDHDLGAFVSIGTGTVSENGMTVTSDPGFGVIEAGWHCVARPTPPGTVGAADLPPNAEPLRVCRNNGDDTGGTATVRLNTNLVSWLPASLAWSVSGGGNAITLTNPGSMACLNGHAQGPHAGQGQITTGFTAFATGADTISMSAVCCQTGQTFGPATKEVIVSEPEIVWLDDESLRLAGGEPAPRALQVNDDDDDQNGIADKDESPSSDEDDLRAVVPRYQPGSEGMHRFVTWHEERPNGAPKRLRMWLQAQPGVQWQEGCWLPLSDPPPVALVEALLPSQATGDAGFRFDFIEGDSEVAPQCATVNPFCGKRTAFTIYRIDLDIDSLNDDGASFPNSSADEDAIEDTHSTELPLPGKLVPTNDDDDDKDWVTDFADGFDFFANLESDAVNTNERFVPVLVSIPPGTATDRSQARIEIQYPGPSAVFPTATSLEPTSWDFEPEDGARARLWRKDGGVQRNALATPGGDFVPPGSYSLDELGFSPGASSTRLYVEATRFSDSVADLRIVARLDPDGSGPLGYVASDAIRATSIGLRLVDTAANAPAVEEIDGGGIAWISPEPEMPRLEVTLEPAALGPSVSLGCRFETNFDRRPGRRPVADFDLVKIPVQESPPVTISGGQTWSLWQNYIELPEGKRFFGGDGFVRCESLPVSLRKELRIRGRNPDPGEARSFIESLLDVPWYAYAIAKLESKPCGGSSGVHYNQFELRVGATSSRKDYGMPCSFLGTIASIRNDGWGMMQVDLGWTDRDVPDRVPSDYLEASQLWNWKELVTRAVEKIRANESLANWWMNEIRPQDPENPVRPIGQRWQARVEAGNGTYVNQGGVWKVLNWTEVPVILEPDIDIGNCPFEDGGATPFEDAVAVKCYNGCDPHFVSWNNSEDRWQFSPAWNGRYYVREVCGEVEP